MGRRINPPRRGSALAQSLRGIAALLLTVFLFGLIVLPQLRRGREPMLRSVCGNNLKQIGIALNNYHEAYGVFPPAQTFDADGRPLHSWRTLILPYLDQAALYRTIDLTRPWNNPANAAALATPIPYFRCLSLDDQRSNRTTYMVVTGPGTCFPRGKTCSLQDIKDGMADTLMVVEVPADRAVRWMEPVDSGTEMLLDLNRSTSVPHSPGFYALFADGKFRFLSNETPAPRRHAMITIAGDDNADLRDQ